MLDRADAAACYGLVVAGLTHTALTALLYPDGGEGALWFAGTGLALIMLGLLNCARRATTDAGVRRIVALGNLAGLAYMAVVTAMLPAPHVLLILAMLALVTIRSLRTALPAAAPTR